MFFSKKNVYDYMIVGLGNPGSQYSGTRHNAGFCALDLLAGKLNAPIFKLKHKALFCDVKYGSKRILLVKPQTFMNLSGEAVNAFYRFYGIPSEKVVVLMDDISLPAGKLRIRKNGSDGGHNGLKSIQLYIGQDYPRIKLGVGEKPHPEYDLSKWVLSKFSDSDKKLMDGLYKKAVDAILEMLDGDIASAMNKYN